jgi:hypothetical protein
MSSNIKLACDEHIIRISENKINKNYLLSIFNSKKSKKPIVSTGNKFFHFRLDRDLAVAASLMDNGEIRIYAEYVDTDYLPHKVMIGVLSDDMIIQDPVMNWPKRTTLKVIEHPRWPGCLVALKNAVIIVSVMLT